MEAIWSKPELAGPLDAGSQGGRLGGKSWIFYFFREEGVQGVQGVPAFAQQLRRDKQERGRHDHVANGNFIFRRVGGCKGS